MFASQLGKNMEVYSDNMLTKSLEADSHQADLEETFTTLRRYNMRLNPEKCVFGVTSGKFLGFMVHQRGIEANPDKIKAIQELQSPRTIKEIQGLTGPVIALSRFVSRLTDRCLPFFRALKKNTSNTWTSECEKAFQELKCYLTSPPMLSKPQTGETLFLYLAVSPEAVSSVLIRNDEGTQRAVYYVSKAITSPEMRYSEIEKLALALIITARRLQPYFQAHPIIVLTKHPLRQVMQKLEASGRMIKWSVELSEFEISFQPRNAVKGQAISDFVSEFTVKDVASVTSGHVSNWKLFVDGSSNRHGSGAGIVIQAPDGTLTQLALRFGFRATNNITEYEALIQWLKATLELGVEHLLVYSDSQLIVNQVNNEYRAKDEKMIKYFQIVSTLRERFS
ncbi:hypothetical protein ACOSP7_024169 [Xanthoceras sorbifolium]